MNGEADHSRFVSMHVYMYLAFKEVLLNSSAGEANYCCTHVVRFRVAGKTSLQTTYTNMSRKQLLTCVVTTKVLTD